MSYREQGDIELIIVVGYIPIPAGRAKAVVHD